MGVSDIVVEKAIRLGKRNPNTGDEGDVSKPRPRKLMLNSEGMRNKILTHTKNLKTVKEGIWKGLVIHKDMTPRGREERKAMLEELKRREAAGEKNLALIRGSIVQKRCPRDLTEES